MIITTVLNNNAVLAKGSGHDAIVVFGKGIGFHKKRGDTVDKEKIESVYIRDNSNVSISLNSIPAVYLQAAHRIFAIARSQAMTHLNDSMFFSLADHLFASVNRVNKGVELQNPFLYELEMYFPKEWHVAQLSKPVISEMFHVEFGRDELGYIALHLIEEDKMIENLGVRKTMRLIDDIMAIVIPALDLDSEDIRSSYQYSRLLTHVKLFAYRFARGEQLKDSPDLNLKILLDDNFKVEVDCINTISDYLFERYQKRINNQEILYLAIHFKNIRDSFQ